MASYFLRSTLVIVCALKSVNGKKRTKQQLTWLVVDMDLRRLYHIIHIIAAKVTQKRRKLCTAVEIFITAFLLVFEP